MHFTSIIEFHALIYFSASKNNRALHVTKLLNSGAKLLDGQRRPHINSSSRAA